MRCKCADLVVSALFRFAWAVGQLDALRSCGNDLQARECLRRRPPCVDHTFFRALKRIPDEGLILARCVLQWLAFSARQMSLEELAEATLINIEAGQFNPIMHGADTRGVLESSTDLST